MKKIFAGILLLTSLMAHAGNTFNTLDAAPSVSIGAALPSGTNLVGKVGIDQTTPGTTNKVSIGTDGTVAATQSGTYTVQPGNTANTTPWLASDNDGASTANNIAGDSGQTARVMAGARREVSFTTTTVQAVGATDVSNYAWISVHIVTQGGSSTVTFQGSNDNTNWVSTELQLTTNSQNSTVTSTTSAASIYSGPTQFRYFRLNVTGIASGTTAGVIEFFGSPRSLATFGVTALASQTGTWTVQPGNTANTTAWKVDGSAVTQPVSMGASATGAYSFSNLKANATTTVKSGAGTLHTISINTKGLTNTVTVYDNTAGSGTTIATIDTTLGQDTLTFDLAFSTGLTVVIAGGTAADITVTYK